MSNLSVWSTLVGLGAFHGLNPAMGWLFAVALGLQKKNRAAVWRALPPIALGHALSIGVILGVVVALQGAVSHQALRIGSAFGLFAFGTYRLFQTRHPKWVGMRVGFRDLTAWSFIMASAHGAGLMLIPLVVQSPSSATTYAVQVSGGSALDPICTTGVSTFSTPFMLASSIGLHTLGHLVVSALVALVVYEKFGVAILRRAWFNVDLAWTVALLATGACILL